MTLKSDPTDPIEFILERYVYNYKTGTVHWKSIYSADGCGSLISSRNRGGGYLCTQVCGKSIYMHHVVWILTTGKPPAAGNVIDHIDGDNRNNACHNLREVSQSENMHNQRCKGYTWHKKANKWRAQIKINGGVQHLGYFTAEEEARAAYEDAKKRYGFIHR